MSKPTPEQIAKLPKWAQEHIEQLGRLQSRATKTLSDHLDKQTVSKIWTGWSDDDRRYIQDSRIVFEVENGYLQVSSINDGETVQVMATGGFALAVLPKSGNMLHLRILPRQKT